MRYQYRITQQHLLMQIWKPHWRFISRLLLLSIGMLTVTGCANLFSGEPHPSTRFRNIDAFVSEDLRTSMKNITVQPVKAVPKLKVAGYFHTVSASKGNHVAKGAAEGVASGMDGLMSGGDPFALILAPIVLPVAAVVGAAINANEAAQLKQIEAFEKKMIEDFENKSTTPLHPVSLSESLSAEIDRLPDFNARTTETSPQGNTLPSNERDTIVLEVDVPEINLWTTEDHITIMPDIVITIRNPSDSSILFQRSFTNREKIKIKTFIKEDNAAQAAYLKAIHRQISQAIAGEIFSNILVRHVLRPADKEIKDKVPRTVWSRKNASLNPTLRWELFLLGDDAYGDWAMNLDASDTRWQLEIYSEKQRVYHATNIEGPRHKVGKVLEKCKTYEWSVRPHYRIDDESESGSRTRIGEWMRNPSNHERRLYAFRSEAALRGNPTAPSSSLAQRLNPKAMQQALLKKSAMETFAHRQHGFAQFKTGCKK